MEANERTIEGRNAVLEALRAGRPIDRLFIQEGAHDNALQSILREGKKHPETKISFVDKERLDELSETGKHQGVIALSAAYSYASVEDILEKAAEKGEPPYRIVFYFLTTGTIVGAALTLMTGGFHAIDFYGLALILLIGLFGTLGQFTLTYAWKYGVPLINTLYQYSGVVFAVILGMFLFDDSFDWITILGIFIVCASGIAASLCGMKERENKRDTSLLKDTH